MRRRIERGSRYEDADPLTSKDIEEWLLGYMGVHRDRAVETIVDVSGESKHTIVPVLYHMQANKLCTLWRNKDDVIIASITQAGEKSLTNQE